MDWVMAFIIGGIILLVLFGDIIWKHFNPPPVLPDWEILEDGNGEFSVVRNNLDYDDMSWMTIHMALKRISGNNRGKFANIEQAKNAIKACEEEVERVSNSYTTVKRHKYP